MNPETNEAWISRGKAHLLQNYRTQPVVIERGDGVFAFDVEGRRYLDMIAGVATTALGHGHPAVLAAAKAQLERIWHTSNGVYTKPSIELAEKLCRLAGLDRAFFCNSGGEANEALLKLARKFHKEAGHPERFEVICFDNSFHGRTLATTAATGQPKYHKGFEPLPQGFLHVPYGDLGAVERALSEKTAAILVEPVQGEGGVTPAPAGFLRGLRALCDQKGILLLVDEIQTGMGRTGTFFGFQHDGVLPDAISMAKALGNGLPIGAIVCKDAVGKALTPGSHGSTFGGNAVACAAANAVVDVISPPAFLSRVAENGQKLLGMLERLRAKLPQKVAQVRCKGLLAGVEVGEQAAAVVGRCRELGMLVNLAGERTVRLAPALIVEVPQLEEAVSILERAIAG